MLKNILKNLINLTGLEKINHATEVSLGRKGAEVQ